MTKMIKMSLVAAVAVAGLNTTVSAKPLEEAIKGVDVSGMLRYRYEHKEDNVGLNPSATSNVYDLDISVTSPVNDMLSATVATLVDATTTTVDADPTIGVENAYFTLTTSAATAMAGKQGIPGPFDDGLNGTGLVGLIPAGSVTVAVGHFENTNAAETTLNNGTANALAVIGAMGDIKADFWYLSAPDAATLTSLHVSAPVGPVKIDARHSTGEIDSKVATAGDKTDASTTKVVATGMFGAIGVKGGFVMTGDNGLGTVATRVSLGADSDSATEFQFWNVNVADKNDATGILADFSTEVAPKTKVSLGMFTVDYGSSTGGNDGASSTETKVQVDYKMSKNFNLMARYATWDVQASSSSTTIDYSRSRIEAKYTF